MVLFSVQLLLRDFRVAKDVDGSVPDASGNGAHRDRCIPDGRKFFKPFDHTAIRVGQSILLMKSVREVQMNRNYVFAI
jgi:hypothetical protein